MTPEAPVAFLVYKTRLSRVLKILGIYAERQDAETCAGRALCSTLADEHIRIDLVPVAFAWPEVGSCAKCNVDVIFELPKTA